MRGAQYDSKRHDLGHISASVRVGSFLSTEFVKYKRDWVACVSEEIIVVS